MIRPDIHPKHEALKSAQTGKTMKSRAMKHVKNYEHLRKHKTHEVLAKMARVDSPHSKGYDVKR